MPKQLKNSIGHRNQNKYVTWRCDYDPDGDFTGNLYTKIEINPMAFSNGARFTELKTQNQYILQAGELVLDSS